MIEGYQTETSVAASTENSSSGSMRDFVSCTFSKHPTVAVFFLGCSLSSASAEQVLAISTADVTMTDRQTCFSAGNEERLTFLL